uniref:SET domain-containing protein n=1 Tax=Ditylenchus dipsaci TaxID=166011 RepID=A0A915DCI8_9BILA
MEAVVQQLFHQSQLDEQRNSGDQRPRPNQSRQQYIVQWNEKQLASRMTQMGIGGSQAVKKMVIAGNSHSSKLPLSNLQSILLSQMKVPLVHRECYLVCRVISDAIVEVGTSVLIEDLRDDVEELILFNFQYDLTNTTWLSKGTIMLVKEPYLKYSGGESGLQIRVDSPSDVIFIDEADELRLQAYGASKWYVPSKLTFDQLRQKGNDSYAAKNYEAALKWYKKAMLLVPDSPVIYLNQAACLLELGCYCEAHEKAGKALSSGADKRRLFTGELLGKAAYGMREWQLAIDHFKRLHHDYPSDKEVSSLLNKANDRLQESLTGDYNLNELYKQSVLQKKLYMDVADYVGPVEIVDIKGKGKGLVATRDVQKGTLLLVSKAFCLAFEDDLKADLCSITTFERTMETKKQALCIIKAIQMLRKNKHKASDLYALFAGDMPRGVEIPSGVIDTARIEKICTYNRISLEPEFDVSQVKEQIPKGEDRGSGLWILPSFINHSCLDPQKAWQIIKAVLPQLRNTYARRHQLKTQLISALVDSATFFMKINKHQEAISLLKEADEYVGEEFWHVYGVFIRINISYCYFALRDLAQAKQYALEAVAMNKLRFGWDVTLFKMLFPNLAKS